MLRFIFLLISFSALADDLLYEDYQSLSHIPEPMVFDLVRPLGSKKGQWETNMILTQEKDPKLSRSHESPEIEYVFMDDLAAELEIPGVGGEPEAIKGVLQWTLGHLFDHKESIHGLQLIHERYVQKHPYSETTPLYVYGHRFNDVYSALLIVGDQLRYHHAGTDHRLVLNATLFRVYSKVKDIEFGLEQNLLGFGRNFEYWRITPQVDLILEDHWKIQTGFGTIYSYAKGWDSTSSIRIVKEFY